METIRNSSLAIIEGSFVPIGGLVLLRVRMNSTISKSYGSSMNLPVYVAYMVQGLLIPAGDFIIVLAIARFEALRSNKEYVILSGLSLADGLKMMGYFFAGLRRFVLTLKGEYNGVRSAVECLLVGHNIFWSLGMRLSVMMLTVVSGDRLCAVLFPLRYLGWTVSYARKLIVAVYAFHFLNVIYYSSRVLAKPDVAMLASCPIVPLIRETTHGFYFRFYQFTDRLFPVLTVFMFTLVLLLLRKKFSVAMLTEHPNQRYELQRQRRITITLSISVACTFLLYVVPFSIALKLFSWGYVTPGIVFMCISNFNSLANIFVYPMRHREVRQAIVALFCCKHMPIDLKMWNPVEAVGPGHHGQAAPTRNLDRDGHRAVQIAVKPATNVN